MANGEDNEQNGWSSYRRLVLAELEDLHERIKDLEEKYQALYGTIKEIDRKMEVSEKEEAEEEQAKKTKWGWIVSILIGAIGAIGAILSAIIESKGGDGGIP